MHRQGCPLTSGRIAMWRCIPILLISPIVSTFINEHDLLIYLLIIYLFIVVLLWSFRNLCHEWTTWQNKVPTIKEKDIIAWYKKKQQGGTTTEEKEGAASFTASARALLTAELATYSRPRWYAPWRYFQDKDQFVHDMAVGMPFALWLLEKESPGAELPEEFTATWFVQLELALNNQKQLMRGLKEHSQFILFRYSKYDVRCTQQQLREILLTL